TRVLTRVSVTTMGGWSGPSRRACAGSTPPVRRRSTGPTAWARAPRGGQRPSGSGPPPRGRRPAAARPAPRPPGHGTGTRRPGEALGRETGHGRARPLRLRPSSPFPSHPSNAVTGLPGPVVAAPEIDVFAGVASDILQLLGAHLPHGLGGHAHHEPPRGDHLARRHERARADLGALFHDGAVQDDGADADAHVGHDRTGVHDRAVADRDVIADDARIARRDVQDGGVLDVRIPPEPDVVVLVAAQHRAGPDARPASMITSPITWAEGSIQVSGWMRGARPGTSRIMGPSGRGRRLDRGDERDLDQVLRL